MIFMARTEDSDGKIQGNSLSEVRAGLKIATIRLSPKIPRPGKRPLEYGLILSRLAAWYLLQDHKKQAEILEEGHRVIEALKEMEPGPLALDDSLAASLRASLGLKTTEAEDVNPSSPATGVQPHPLIAVRKQVLNRPDGSPADAGLIDSPPRPRGRVKRSR